MSSSLNDLFERRVPQWTAVYIGAGWGLVQFIAFIEERYLISPHWTDLALLTLGLLLPSVVLYTYNHGRPGADRIQRSEKVGIPVNLVIAALVIWLVFGKKDLGAMTTEVTVTDANGATIERDLAKPEHRRRVAVFTPDVSAGGDTAWVGEAMTLGMMIDLAQDSWVDIRFGPYFAERLREAGFQPGQSIPLALKREIADEMNLTHFVAGTVDAVAGGYATTLRLYDADRGRLVTERSYRGADLFALIDSATSRLREDLGIPAAHLDEVEDLPVAERMTPRIGALRSYARGAMALMHNEWIAASRHFGQAIDQDSTFAMAAVDLMQARLMTGDPQGAMAALAIANNHLYRLPERIQFTVRAAQHQLQQQNDRAIEVFETAAELYPDDVRPRLGLAALYPMFNREQDAVAALEYVLRIDPAQIEYLLTIGAHHRALGHDDSAFAAYRRYVEAAPERPDGPRAIGDLHAARGEHQQALAQYERALALDSNDIDVLLALANLSRDTGEFDDARRHLDAAMTTARTPEARWKTLEARSELLRWLGRPAAAFDESGRAIQEAARFQPPLVIAVYELGNLKPLAEAGRAEEAERRLGEITPRLAGPFAEIAALGALSIEAGRPERDVARIEAAANRVDGFIRATQWEMVKPQLLHARGMAAELRGDYATALRLYQEQLALDPANTNVHTDIGRVHRLRGDLPAATRALAITLGRRPADAKARYELALVHEAAGRATDAVTELRRALEIWSDAEPVYAPAARARSALDRLLAARPAAG